MIQWGVQPIAASQLFTGHNFHFILIFKDMPGQEGLLGPY